MMQMTRLVRSLLAAIALACAAAPGCGKQPEVTAESIEELGTVPEAHDTGSVVWSVTPDGQVNALVKDPDGKPVEKDVTGTLTVKPSKGAEPVKAELKPVEKAGGVLAATIPKLEAELTEVSYELKVGDKSFQGVLHLPKGGTKELLDSAKQQAEAKLEGKKGPNGGIVQVVGEDTVEIVADKKTGKVRAYLLDDDLKPAKVIDRKVKLKLALSGEGSEVVELLPSPTAPYFEGKLNIKIKPTKITVVLIDVDVVHVALWGWYPGKVIVVGPSAPVVAVFVNVNWDVDVVVKPPVVVVGDDDDDDDHVIIVGKGKGKKGKWRIRR
jgi:hypothetical protein